MIRLIDILTEAEYKISHREFNSKAKSYFNKLSDADVIALRSWTINLDKPSKPYITRKQARKYISYAPNITGVSQEFIKSLIGTKDFEVYRAYNTSTSSSGLKSYTLRSSAAQAFNYWDTKKIDTRTITYKDVIAVPAISFKGWEEAGSYDNEYEIVLSI